MSNKNLGLYVGFTLFAVQTIASDAYRQYKQEQHNNKIKSYLSIALSSSSPQEPCNATKSK
jgi:hypothetical protein